MTEQFKRCIDEFFPEGSPHLEIDEDGRLIFTFLNDDWIIDESTDAHTLDVVCAVGEAWWRRKAEDAERHETKPLLTIANEAAEAWALAGAKPL